MSRIDELIEEFCSNGVQYLELGRVIKHLRTGLNPRSNFSLNGPNSSGWYVTVRELAGFDVRLHANTDRVDAEALEVIQARSQLKYGDVLFSGTGTIGRTALVTNAQSDWNIKEGVYALTPDQEVIGGRFLIYLLHSESVRRDLLSKSSGSTVQSIPFSALQKVKIPVPPLEVQREIVSILDRFTQLEAELEAELEARKVQYEVTRDRLLDFSGDLEKHPLAGAFTKQVLGNTPMQQLGDLVEYSRDRVPASTLGPETFVGVDNLRANKMGLSDSDYVPTTGQLTKFGFGSVLLGNIRPYLRKIWLSDREGGCSGDVLCFNRKAESAGHVTAGYLYHCLASENFFRFNVQHSKGAKMPRGDKKALMGYPIFLPTIEVQNEIVSVLDKLDALVNDITIGLPAEIAARRKQYEYYRNELLTFKELEAA